MKSHMPTWPFVGVAFVAFARVVVALLAAVSLDVVCRVVARSGLLARSNASRD